MVATVTPARMVRGLGGEATEPNHSTQTGECGSWCKTRIALVVLRCENDGYVSIKFPQNLVSTHARRSEQEFWRAAKLPFPLHPHMLRHACGYKLANDGHDTRSLAHYLGHRNLQSTARYTALAPDRFARFWQD